MKDGVTGSASVTAVTFSNANFNGQYAFSFLGSNFNDPLVGAGTLQADGQGHISNGILDLNNSVSVTTNGPFSGTYTVGPDGRGSAVITGSVSTSFDFVLTVSGEGVIAQFDTASTASGVLAKQDASAFHTATLNSSFAFSLGGTGIDPSTGSIFPGAIIGQLNPDGAGNIPNGQADINDAGNYSNVFTPSGTYSIAANGRGTVTLHDPFGDVFNVAIYMVSSNRALLVELDPDSVLVGSAMRQTGGLGNAAFNGNYVLSQSGITSDDAFNFDFFLYGSVGVMTADGAGNFTNGVRDVNDNNLGVFEALPYSGTYSANTTGRGTAALTDSNGTMNYVFYQVSPTTAYFLSTDSFTVLTGIAEQQAPATYSNANLLGNFGLLLNDDLIGANTISGQFVGDGSGNLHGTVDENSVGNLASDVPLTGTYSVQSNGRGTAAVDTVVDGVDSTSNLHFYFVSGSKLRFLEVDPAIFMVGVGEKQF
jgi:hypothetical protein